MPLPTEASLQQLRREQQAAAIAQQDGYDPSTGLRRAPPGLSAAVLGVAPAPRTEAEYRAQLQERAALKWEHLQRALPAATSSAEPVLPVGAHTQHRVPRNEGAPRMAMSHPSHGATPVDLRGMYQPGRHATVGMRLAAKRGLPVDEHTTEVLQSVVSRYASYDETTGRHKLAGNVGRYGEFAVYGNESDKEDRRRANANGRGGNSRL